MPPYRPNAERDEVLVNTHRTPADLVDEAITGMADEWKANGGDVTADELIDRAISMATTERDKWEAVRRMHRRRAEAGAINERTGRHGIAAKRAAENKARQDPEYKAARRESDRLMTIIKRLERTRKFNAEFNGEPE